MFEGITWSDFLMFVVVACALYYTVVYLVYFFPYDSTKKPGKEIKSGTVPEDVDEIGQDSIMENNPFITSVDEDDDIENTENINNFNNINNIDNFETENEVVQEPEGESSGSIGGLLQEMQNNSEVAEFEIEEYEYPIPTESEELDDYSFMNDSEEDETSENGNSVDMPVSEKDVDIGIENTESSADEETEEDYLLGSDDDFSFGFGEIEPEETTTNEAEEKQNDEVGGTDSDLEDDVFDFNK